MVITPAARSTVYRDTGGAYRETYAPAGPSVYRVRPDRHVGLRSCPVLPGAVRDHLATIFTIYSHDHWLGVRIVNISVAPDRKMVIMELTRTGGRRRRRE